MFNDFENATPPGGFLRGWEGYALAKTLQRFTPWQKKSPCLNASGRETRLFGSQSV